MNTNLLKNCMYIFVASDEEPRWGEDIFIRGNRIEKIGSNLPDSADRTVDCSTCVVVPGFINTHHHFYQTLTRNLPAVQNSPLFEWLKYLYEIWKHLDAETVYYASMLAMGELLKTGCTTSVDHHYIYPQAVSADLTALQFDAADKLGMRFSPARGSMSLSKKDGGLPPDILVQTEDEILADCERVIHHFHDASELSMRRIVLGPCSPFSVTENLMRETAVMARTHGIRLHTHWPHLFLQGIIMVRTILSSTVQSSWNRGD